MENKDYEDFILKHIECEWDKRKKCDSLYIKVNKDLTKVIEKAINYVESTENIDKKKLLDILKRN